MFFAHSLTRRLTITFHIHTHTRALSLSPFSNFFKAGPDGTVRAFSNPVIHERNKNATTAGRLMGFPVPERPHAIVLGSHEDDVLMTEGAPGVREQISVGVLELADDLTQRLPAFLSAYDVVILGEGGLQHFKALLDDVLGLSQQQQQQNNNELRNRLGGVGQGLRERLGFLKNLGEGLTGGGGGLGGGADRSMYGSELF